MNIKKLVVAVLVTLASLGVAWAQDEPTSGGTLTIALETEIVTLDPAATSSWFHTRVFDQLYDRLVALDHDLATVVPNLAEGWEVSEDGLQYTFTLRDDITFHSGDPVTSSDVEFTLERLAEGELAESGIVLGMQEVEVVDDRTFVLHMSQPNSEFLRNLAGDGASILNEEAVLEYGEDYGRTYVDGTGPFKLEEYNPGEGVVMVRNEDYSWGPSVYENQGPAYLERVVWDYIPEPATRILQLRSGGVDVVPPRLPGHMITSLEQDPSIHLEEYNLGVVVPIGYNVAKPPLDDVRVRKALNHAIDAELIINSVIYGQGTDADGLVAPAAYGHWAGVSEFAQDYDPEEAARLLEDAGWEMGEDDIRYKDGQPLTLSATIAEVAPYPGLFEIIQRQWADIGVDLDFEVVLLGTAFQVYGQGDHQVWAMGLSHNSSYEVLARMDSRDVPGGNYFWWQDPQTDEWIDQGVGATSEEEALEAWQELQRIAVENAIAKPLYFERGVLAVSNSVHDLRPHGLGNTVFYKLLDAWVDDAR